MWRGEGQRKEEQWEKKGKSRYEEVQGSGGTRAVCPEPDLALRFAKTVESSSHSDSRGVNGARET